MIDLLQVMTGVQMITLSPCDPAALMSITYILFVYRRGSREEGGLIPVYEPYTVTMGEEGEWIK